MKTSGQYPASHGVWRFQGDRFTAETALFDVAGYDGGFDVGFDHQNRHTGVLPFPIEAAGRSLPDRFRGTLGHWLVATSHDTTEQPADRDNPAWSG